MRFGYAKEIIAVVLVLVLVGAGLAAQVRFSGWAVLGAIALASIVILQRLWRNPAQTISESIQNARR